MVQKIELPFSEKYCELFTLSLIKMIIDKTLPLVCSTRLELLVQSFSG